MGGITKSQNFHNPVCSIQVISSHSTHKPAGSSRPGQTDAPDRYRSTMHNFPSSLFPRFKIFFIFKFKQLRDDEFSPDS